MKKVTVILPSKDYRLASNGGEYEFRTVFTPQERDMYTAEFFTSSEFPYCRVYAQWGECRTCPEQGSCQPALVPGVVVRQLVSMLDSLEGRKGNQLPFAE